jgi:hypothetical protein
MTSFLCCYAVYTLTVYKTGAIARGLVAVLHRRGRSFSNEWARPPEAPREGTGRRGALAAAGGGAAGQKRNMLSTSYILKMHET